MDPATLSLESVFSKSLDSSFSRKINDLSIDATSKLAVIGGERGLYVVNLDSPDDGDIIITKKFKYEIGKLECNPHISAAQLVVSAAGTNMVLWDVVAERVLSTVFAHNRAVTGVSWNRQNPAIVATDSPDATICLWDVRTPKTPSKLSSFSSHTSSSAHVEFHPHKEHILASSHAGHVKVWDIRNATSSAPIAMFPAHMTDISSIHWSTDPDSVILTCSQDKHVKSWKLLTNQPNSPQCTTTTLTGFPVSLAQFVPGSSRHIVTSHFSHNAMYVWVAGNLTPQISLPVGAEPPISFDWRRVNGDNYAVVVTKDLRLRTWCIPSILEDDVRPISPRVTSPIFPHTKPHNNEYVPVSLGLEFAHLLRSPFPGFRLRDTNIITRSCRVVFATEKHGQFSIQVTFPTLYPYSAPPIFEFVEVPPFDSETRSVNQTKIDIKHRLDEVATEHVLHDRPCLAACIDALSKWVTDNLGEVVPSDRSALSTSSHGVKGRDRSKSSPALPTTMLAKLGVSPQKHPKLLQTASQHSLPALPPPPTRVPAGHVLDLHSVTSSDTLMGIAIAHDMAPAVLKKHNRLYSNQVIPGQQLWVFKKKVTEGAEAPSANTQTDATANTDTSTDVNSSAGSPFPVHVVPPPPDLPQPTFLLPTSPRIAIPAKPNTNTNTNTNTKTNNRAKTRFAPAYIDINQLLKPTKAETQLLSQNYVPQVQTTTKATQGIKPQPSLMDVVKETVIYWSPSFFVRGTLTLTPQLVVFEPAIDDPFVIRGGIVQFQLCVELSQLCSLKLFRSKKDWYRRVGQQNSEQDEENYDEDKSVAESDSNNPMKFPCIELVALAAKRMQTIQFRDLPLDKLEPLFTNMKQWVVESRTAATMNGAQLPLFRESPNPNQLAHSYTPIHTPSSSYTPTSSSTSLVASLIAPSALMDEPSPSLLVQKGSTQLLQEASRVKKLRSILPARLCFADWEMLYSTSTDGFNLHTFYNKVRNTAPSLLLVEDDKGHVFGALLSDPWKSKYDKYYGTGECKLFKLAPEFKAYKWSKKNDFFMYSDEEYLALGGGKNGFGLWLDADFDQGVSNESATFDNECLASSRDFRCITVEAWGFST